MSLSKHGCSSRKKERGIYIFYLSRQCKVYLKTWNETGPLASHIPLYNFFVFIFTYTEKKTGKGRSMAVGTCDSIFVTNSYKMNFLSSNLKMLTISR